MKQEMPTTEATRIVLRLAEEPIRKLALSDDVEKDLGPRKPEHKVETEKQKGGES